MLLQKEKYRQILFLILIIGCTIVTYSSWYFKNDKRTNNESISALEKRNNNLLNSEVAAEILFRRFIKNPNSEEGVNSLFDAVVRWELNGKKDSVQFALKKFETAVKNKTLKNSFYSRLGQFYISSYKKMSFSSAGIKKANELLKPGNS